MAKQSVHYRADHLGFEFFRSSVSRTYTHAVVVAGSYAADRADCERGARYTWKLNLAYHQAFADGSSEFLQRKTWEKDDAAYAERIAKETADGQAHVALGLDGFVAQQLAAFDARAAARSNRSANNDGDTYFWCAGWCGRADLAQKLAAKQGGVVLVAVPVKSHGGAL